MKYRPLSIGMSFGLAIGILVASAATLPSVPAQSREPDKTLKLFFGHTGEKAEFTFKRNGVYDRGELKRLNHFLRDWRRDEDAHMDPHLLDLVWAIYQQTGSRDYIHIVSAYRSPATNEMLRRRSSGVAKNSQHRLGKAMDWFLTDVPLAKLRATAMKMQGGGVGYYPTSGSPFVHTDTGNVRAWPRMSRQQLLALFPNGNTLHLPADGKPLPGYELALAKRKASPATALAYLDTGEESEVAGYDRTGTSDTSSNGWLKRIFPGKKDSSAVADAAPPPSPAPQMVAAADDESADDEVDIPRQPRARPAGDADASGETVVASIDPAQVPVPRVRPAGPDNFPSASTGDAQDAIASLTERMNQESPDAAVDPAQQPIALAFAAASDSQQPSAADRAILTAFATVKSSTSVRPADATLTAAVTQLAAAENQQPTTLALAYTGSTSPAPEAQPAGGVVIGPAEAASYSGDEHALVSMIEKPAKPAPHIAGGSLAMPTPEASFLQAPGAASEVADLRGRSGPPVERFARAGEQPEQKSFFTRLFASLIE